VGKGCIKKELLERVVLKTDDNCDRVIFLALILPIYSSQAGGEFGSVRFVMCYAGARQKRRFMIKLLHNKCNGRASSSQIKKSSS